MIASSPSGTKFAHKKKDSTLSYGEKAEFLSHLGLIRYRVVTLQTDRRTDRIAIANTRLAVPGGNVRHDCVVDHRPCSRRLTANCGCLPLGIQKTLLMLESTNYRLLNILYNGIARVVWYQKGMRPVNMIVMTTSLQNVTREVTGY